MCLEKMEVPEEEVSIYVSLVISVCVWAAKCVAKKGYKDVVVHVSFFQVLHDGVLCDLGQQDHVVHPALFNILTLPVIFSLKSHSEQR